MTDVVKPNPPVGRAGAGSPPALVFVVSSDAATLRRTEALLAEQGNLVSVAASFPAARDLLRAARPDLLIADLRLEAFNGLHLAVFGRAQFPQLQVIITNPEPSEPFKAEAAKLGAVFFSRTLGESAFIELVRSVLSNASGEASRIRQWPRKRTTSDLEAQIAGEPAHVVDVSYGGLRLAFNGERDVPAEFELTLPAANVTLRAQRVWTTRSATGDDELWCGVTVAPGGELPPLEWRDFVDNVT